MYEIVSKVRVSHDEMHDKVSHEKIDELVKSVSTFRKIMQNFIGSGITHNEINKIKHITKMIRFLENGGILLKDISKTIISQYGGLLSFLRSLLTAGL